jgi:hypothetical protein
VKPRARSPPTKHALARGVGNGLNLFALTGCLARRLRVTVVEIECDVKRVVAAEIAAIHIGL